MELLRIISIFILFIGIAFIMAEVFTEEVEFFAPLAVITIIIGLILFFLSDPKEWLGIDDFFYPMFVAIILIIASIPIIFSILILIKIGAIKHKPPELLDYIGKEVEVVKPINADQKGYVLFRGEKWQALSSDQLEPGDIAIIETAHIEGLTLNVRKTPIQPHPSERGSKKKDQSPVHSKTKKCPYCSNEIDTSFQICPQCGLDLKS